MKKSCRTSDRKIKINRKYLSSLRRLINEFFLKKRLQILQMYTARSLQGEEGHEDYLRSVFRMPQEKPVIWHISNSRRTDCLCQPMRKLHLTKGEETDKFIKEMEEEEKGRSTRFCVDYRQFTNVTEKYSYSLPRKDDTFDNLANSKSVRLT